MREPKRSRQPARRWWLTGVAMLGLTVVSPAAVSPAHAAEPLNLLRVSKKKIDLGAATVGKRSSRLFTIQNGGAAPLRVTFSSISSPFGARWHSAMPFGETVSLKAGEWMMMEVVLSPPEAGDFHGSLRLTSDDALHPSVEVKLTGRGVFSTELPSIHGTWTTPDGDAFHLTQASADTFVVGTFELSFGDPNNRPTDFTLELRGDFDGKRWAGEGYVIPKEKKHLPTEGLFAFELTHDGTLVKRDSDGDSADPTTLTRLLTDYSGWWKADDGTLFYFSKGPSGIVGGFEYRGTHQKVKASIRQGKFVGQRLLANFDATVELSSGTLESTGTLEVYQIATGRLRCRRTYARSEPMGAVTLTLEGPFEQKP
jgi:hypothetical protein